MKLKSLLVASVLGLGTAFSPAAPLGTSFTYQGRLTEGANPAHGTYFMLFELYDALAGGTRVATPPGTNTVAVSNGLFSVDLDFGATAFLGDARWLEISVRTNGGLPVVLSPRTRVAPAPGALYASTAGTVKDGSIQAGQLGTVGSPPFSGQMLSYDGSALVWQFPVAAGGAWAVGGNNASGGQFLGTLNNLPLELKANDERVLRLEPNSTSPNLVAGWRGNGVSPGAFGGTIGGGGVETFFGRPGTNRVTDDFGTVSGGANNVAGLDNGDVQDGWFATVSGGQFNRAEGIASSIGGGSENRTSNNDTTVGGGYQNQAINLRATVGGGQLNVASGMCAFIGGGYNNTALGGSAAVAGGTQNAVEGDESIVGGGYQNIIGPGSSDATIAGGRQNQIQTNAYQSSIGGGNFNKINSSDSVIGGGAQNKIQTGASGSIIAGGTANTVAPDAYASFIGGGYLNVASGIYATIPGGLQNEASGNYSFAAGSHAKARQPGAFVWADSQAYDFVGDSPNSVNFRCAGGVGFHSGNFLGANQTVSWTPGNASWSFSSDRNLKDRLQTVDPQGILAKVCRLPISEWSYKGFPQRHIGAMAQDFHALFPLNNDDKALNDADLHGVALAAIQGLNSKLAAALKEKESTIARLERELAGVQSAQRLAGADWEARFTTLQKAIARLSDKSGAILAGNHLTTEAP